MRRPVGHHVVENIKRLVAGGMSNRQAARIVGCDDKTVGKIVKGQHCSQFSEDAGEVAFHSVPEYECPTCRRRIDVAPCPTCLARRGQ